ncbi:serine carboxypeptidase [Klebsormidium nitens]|uniref:Carboxypeptidase n=1 Tax=Klebsormidium nitens TaxID=105231 RepID=A0A1Y1IH48_KLENI|nr:serine carboxypeptidase [Klebsormidium nitens]|eukprot:GAQ88391.1 serine carboxypeptidase [Klebsormidium nitens]
MAPNRRILPASAIATFVVFSFLSSPVLAKPGFFQDALIKLPSDAADPNAADLIESLPGTPDLPFRQYSGYITVNETHGRALFYWFVEATEEPLQKPVTLWLNGGPGCSSLAGGLLSELGPFYPDKAGDGLYRNKYSWNSMSNMLFVESPAGVGFSYSNTTEDYVVGDERTANDAYQLLVGFFKKFPHYAASDFYISGESYGGHYVPQLADTIVRNNREKVADGPIINLKGFLVGNAWTDAGIDNYGALFYDWTHAIISDAAYYGVANTCDFNEVGPLLSISEKCSKYVQQAFREMGPINIYDIYADVCTYGKAARDETRHFAKQLARTGTPLAARHLLTAPPEYDPCIDDEVAIYLNRPEVQKAIHANVTHLPYAWTGCTEAIEYSRKDLLTSVLPVYRRLLKDGLRMLIFSGDVDAIVPVTGTRAWIGKLLLEEVEPWRPWVLDSQVGGYVTKYKGLTFSTVRDAGHMVPYTQPARALHLFKTFIQDGQL